MKTESEMGQMAGLMASLVIAGALLAACSSTPLIDNGKAGSIAVLEEVTLNGRKEWITIRGHDTTRPLLLFLAGGPGGSELATVRNTLSALEEQFVVVVWDQPGAGKSYWSIRHADLLPETYVADANALVDLLCARFDRDKLFVLGESWGSALGIMLARDHPERIAALFGTGQMVDFLETDRACYRLILDWSRQKGDTELVRKLELQGPPPYSGSGVAMKLAEFLMPTTRYMREVHGVRTSGDTWRDIFSAEYNLTDRVNWFRGLLDTLEFFYPKLWGMDLRKTAPRLTVPVYLLMGRFDVNANLPIVEDYFARLEAPSKELVWFEHSGHTPWTSETGRFVADLTRRSALHE